MHVVVATDGNLDTERAASFAAALAGDDGRVTVLTVIAIPRRLISDLRAVFGERAPAEVESDAEYIGIAAEGTGPVGWPGDKEMIERYLGEKEEERCSALVSALTDAGVSASSRAIEGEQIARAVIAELADTGADVLVVGSHGEGRFEGMIGGTGTKLTRHAPCPVLILR